MLYDLNAALFDLFIDTDICGVQLNGILACRCTYRVHGFIQQIPLGRRNLTDCPVITADIICGCEPSLAVGGVSIHQLTALVDTIDGTRQRCIALCLHHLNVGFIYLHTELFEDVGHGCLGHIIPVNRKRL